MIKTEEVCSAIRKKCGMAAGQEAFFNKTDYQTILNKLNFLEDEIREAKAKENLTKETATSLISEALQKIRGINEAS